MFHHPAWAVEAHQLPELSEPSQREVFTEQMGHPVHNKHNLNEENSEARELLTRVVLALADEPVDLLELRLEVGDALLQARHHLLRLQRPLREPRPHHRVRVELVERRLQERHRERRRHRRQARPDASGGGLSGPIQC